MSLSPPPSSACVLLTRTTISREGGDPAKAVPYLPKDKQFLITRKGHPFPPPTHTNPIGTCRGNQFTRFTSAPLVPCLMRAAALEKSANEAQNQDIVIDGDEVRAPALRDLGGLSCSSLCSLRVGWKRMSASPRMSLPRFPRFLPRRKQPRPRRKVSRPHPRADHGCPCVLGRGTGDDSSTWLVIV